MKAKEMKSTEQNAEQCSMVRNKKSSPMLSDLQALQTPVQS